MESKAIIYPFTPNPQIIPLAALLIKDFSLKFLTIIYICYMNFYNVGNLIASRASNIATEV